ncbi:GAF and ANTAR domain-containing protein [Nocardia sp. BMG51109]|uniref:GAF and ANTAR domain-containing protein n=1 Tax=Nocardia sp. BMG51109 TaxID=1056816 RepID=UPI0004B69697|nr:GAF and ANTAR domain-containing protein [Nocardia sp. BMG51109]
MESALDDERSLLAALVAAVGMLADDFDVIEMAQQLVDACPGVTGATGAGLFLADHRGDLHLLASTTEEPALLDLLQVAALDGPARHTARTGLPTAVPDLRDTKHRFPEFCERALDLGHRSAVALPLRRAFGIGALTLLAPATLDGARCRAGQTLADMAGIGIVQHAVSPRALPPGLPAALQARIVVEQAKGVLAERGRIEMAEAFVRLRGHARETGRQLAELAAAVVDGSADTDAILA